MAKTPAPAPRPRPRSPTPAASPPPQAGYAKSEAEKAASGGKAPNVWPCNDGRTPEACTHAGATLRGRVVYYDPKGGQQEQGSMDVINDANGETVRVYCNSNLAQVLRAQLTRINLDDPTGCDIFARFEGFAETRSGYFVRTFTVGLAPHAEGGQ